MAMVQSLNENHFKTFNDLEEIVQKIIVRLLRNSSIDISQVTIIFDRYDHAFSIKSDERSRGGVTNSVAMHDIQGSRQVPNYRQFLKNSGNKADLANFICQHVCENVYCQIILVSLFDVMTRMSWSCWAFPKTCQLSATSQFMK
jgi:hypothetical protein